MQHTRLLGTSAPRPLQRTDTSSLPARRTTGPTQHAGSFDTSSEFKIHLDLPRPYPSARPVLRPARRRSCAEQAHALPGNQARWPAAPEQQPRRGSSAPERASTTFETDHRHEVEVRASEQGLLVVVVYRGVQPPTSKGFRLLSNLPLCAAADFVDASFWDPPFLLAAEEGSGPPPLECPLCGRPSRSGHGRWHPAVWIQVDGCADRKSSSTTDGSQDAEKMIADSI